MINFKTVIRIIGILLLLETVMLLLCSGVSFYYQDEALVDFWVSAGITAGAGLLLAAMGKGGDRQLTRRGRICTRQLCLGSLLAFRYATVLHQWIYTQHYQRLL